MSVEQKLQVLQERVLELENEAEIKNFSQKLTQALFDISNAVMLTDNLNDLYVRIYEILNELMHLPNFFIAIYVEEGSSLDVPFFVDEYDKDSSLARVINLEKSLTGEVILKRKAVFLGEAELKKREKEERIVGSTPKNWLGVPLFVQKKVIGAMAIQSYDNPDYFDEKDKDLMVSVSHQVALAIERKQNMDEIRSLRNYLSNIINSMPSVLVGVDADGRITQWNRAAELTTELPVAEVLGKKLSEVLPDMVSEINIIKESIATREVRREINKPHMTDKGLRYEDITIFPLVVNGVEGAVIRTDDVTQKHEMEERLSHRSKMDAIGQLAGGVAHDFNNMLGGIMGATELLGKHLPDDPQIKLFVNMILDSAERAAGLTKKLLTFARKQDKESVVIDIHKTIKDTTSLLQSTIDRRIQLEMNLAADFFQVIGDHSQLQSAFLNLTINATHAMPEGGNLFINSKIKYLDDYYCQASPFDLEPGPFLEVEIRDTGKGIKPENLALIFDPFFTTKEQGRGTGLGLSAALGTIQQHKGSITVYSEVGTGTSFHVYLPVANDNDIAFPESLVEAIRGSGRILVVDDEPVMQITAKTILEDLGYAVTLADNGKIALDRFSKDPAAFDLVILDMIMPEMNGLDCFLEMKKIVPDLRVILASGFSREGDVELMKKNGLSGFLLKPFRSTALSQAVHEALSASA